MDWSFKLGDVAIVIATVAGPILAVQAQKLVERVRDKRQRQIWIFRTLMATRAMRVSPEHVNALNAIPVEFYGKSTRLKKIIEAWKANLDYLSQPIVDNNLWTARATELFNELLFSVSQYLGYGFTRLELQREVYYPTAHAQMQTEQDIIRQGLARLFRGEISLPMDVKAFPVDQNFLQNQLNIQNGLIDWLAGQRSVRVTTENKQ